jgi:hypothetical protein
VPVKFKTIPTEDPTIRTLQENISALAVQLQPRGPVVVTVSSNYKILGTEDIVHVDSQQGPVKITLPNPSSTAKPLTIKQVNLQGAKTKVNPVTIVSANGQKTIAGAASLALDDTGTGSVSLTSDDLQHWPATGAGGNPPVPPPTPGTPTGGLVYVAGFGIKIVGNVISWTGSTPPVPPVVPWVAPVPYGNQNTFISNTAGTEAWAAECMVDFTNAPASLTAYLWFEAQDTASAGIVRIRLGGTSYKDITGTQLLSVPIGTTVMTSQSISQPFADAPSLQRVTLTLQSTATNKLTATGVNLLFR